MDTPDTPSPANEPDALDALRADDPAARQTAPDALRERVATLPDTTTSAAPPVAIRRRRWLVPAAAAAALLVGAGGGYLAGAGGTGGLTFASASTPLPVATGSADAPAAPVTAGGGSGDAGAAFSSAEAQTSASMDSVSRWHYANNRRFTVPPFAAGQTEASVYALDGQARFSAEDAQQIAGALGVTGDAHTPDDAYWHSWIVGDEQSSGPLLTLDPTGDGYVSYRSGRTDPWSTCSTSIGPRYDLNTADDAVYQAYDAEVSACVAATPMPTEEQARAALSDFLQATGVDESTTEVAVTADENMRVIVATASRIVDGNVTEVSLTTTVAHDGVLNSGGATAPIVSLGQYTIVSADEAAARLNDPVYAPTYAAFANRDVTYESEPTDGPPALPASGARVPWGVSEFEIVSARLGLGLMIGTQDERFLAPMYEFTDTDGNVWSVLALTEDELDTTGGGSGGGWGMAIE